MKTNLWISLILLCITLLGGVVDEMESMRLSQRYVSAAEELRILTETAQWDRAGEAAASYLSSWQKSSSWMQIVTNHEDIDDVTLALERLQAAIDAQDRSSCFEICAELKENAGHIYHRDAFTLGNVL